MKHSFTTALAQAVNAPWPLRLALMAMLMAFVGVGGYGVRLHDLRQSFAQAHSAELQLQQRHGEATARLLPLAQEREALQAAEARLRDLRWRLSAGEANSDLVERLTLAGQVHGLELLQVDIAPLPGTADVQQAILTVQVLGTYPGVRQWLHEWLAQLRVLRVREASLVPTTGADRQVEAALQVELYDPGEVLEAPESLAHEPARPQTPIAALDLFQPWAAQSTPGDLRQVPLEQVEMVGSLAQGERRYALLSAAGRLYSVTLGDRLGRHGGRVVRLSEHSLEVRKRLYVGNSWQERSRTLALRTQIDQQGSRHRERVGEVGTGGVDVAGLSGAGGG